MKKYSSTIGKIISAGTLMALVATSFGFTFGQRVPIAQAAEGTAKVTINKYIDGIQATAVTASSSDFQMNAAYTISGNSGTGQYALSAGGYNGDPTPYQAVTSDLPIGSDYATNEIIDGVIVGSENSSTTAFSLVGYTSGDTLIEAASATPTTEAPSFTNITNDKFVIVWNKTYVETSTSTVKVTIKKFIDGTQATASSSNGVDFPMSATYDSVETGAGSGTYNLSAGGYNGDPTPYEAKTIDFTQGADYSTNEVLDGSVVGASCLTDQPFALVGYTTGDTLEEAMAATSSTAIPAFTDMTSDKFVIVWNKTCSSDDGTIGGEVTGGATTTPGVLKVTGVTAVKTTAIADGTYANGWKYMFNITVPTNETHLSMKFADWKSDVGSTTLAVANNMRISSAQADNGGATVTLTAANTYSLPTLNMTTDLDLGTPGLQIQVTVEVAVPSTTTNGSYTTSYGVKTQ